MARKKQTSKKPTKAKSKAQAQQAKSTNQPINENINPQQDDTLYKLLDAKKYRILKPIFFDKSSLTSDESMYLL